MNGLTDSGRRAQIRTARSKKRVGVRRFDGSTVVATPATTPN
jgi:hypothetical protein